MMQPRSKAAFETGDRWATLSSVFEKNSAAAASRISAILSISVKIKDRPRLSCCLAARDVLAPRAVA